MPDDKNSNLLRDAIMAAIRDEGPMDLLDYMRIALTDPTYGYYKTATALGAQGDFTTGPEISQMFGELIGLWTVDTWGKMGRPDNVKLVELGPGRGTLMTDALRAIRAAGPMPIDLYLVEINPALRAHQRENLQASWVETMEDVPPGPMILIANEFFDALPIQQFVRTADGWHKVVVDTDGESLATRTIPAQEEAEGCLAGTFANAPEGSIAEHSAIRLKILGGIAQRLSDQSGAALIIDYGPEQSATGDSLQAVKDHQYTNPFEEPGGADLTSHVDFEALGRAAIAEGAYVFGPVTQSAFLSTLGLHQRAESLKRNASAAQRRDIDLAAHRLSAPDQMGTLFKAMAITASDTLAPEGFAI